MTKTCPSFAAISIAMLTLAACANHRGSAGSVAATAPTVNRDGRYAFEERPAGTSRTVEGTFIVLRDTILVDATPGPCQYDARTTPGGPILYKCADISLSFDRRDPVMKARYDYATTESKPKVVCVRYTVGPGGTQTCAETRTDFVAQTVEHSGALRPHRVDPKAEAPPTA